MSPTNIPVWNGGAFSGRWAYSAGLMKPHRENVEAVAALHFAYETFYAFLEQEREKNRVRERERRTIARQLCANGIQWNNHCCFTKIMMDNEENWGGPLHWFYLETLAKQVDICFEIRSTWRNECRFDVQLSQNPAASTMLIIQRKWKKKQSSSLITIIFSVGYCEGWWDFQLHRYL